MSEVTNIPARKLRASPVLVFTGTIFLSAALLFFVQPLYAKLVLPVLGGAPAVWTTAMLFFQTVLIAGYLYAHLMIRYVPPRIQLIVHMSLWAIALFFLPLALPADWRPDPDANTALQTLGVFAVGVGVPFAVLSANAPLLQAWYARSGGPSAEDPYFLYGASNLGSLIALLAFPLVAEPLFGAKAIGQGFAIGFVVLGAGLMLSGTLGLGTPATLRKDSDAATPITLRQIAFWLVLAFVPSSMMLAVTSKISTDVGSLPLIWVVPLALFLLTFVLAFRDSALNAARLKWVGLASVAWLGFVFSGSAGSHLSLPEAVCLVLAFFGLALYAHRRLYEARPAGSQLTAFYLVMSVGGAFGGLFNSIIAPALFDTLVEGGVTTLVGAALLLSARFLPTPKQAIAGVLYAGFAGLVLWSLPRLAGIDDTSTLTVVMLGLAAGSLICLRGKIPAIAIAILLIVVTGKTFLPGEHLFQDRSFFGVHRVTDAGETRKYVNGTTIHGTQFVADLDAAQPRPLAYYHENGPLAAIFLDGPVSATDRIGIVGLGVGALACYAEGGQDWHYYEIDPVVDQVARNHDLFTFVSSCTPSAPTYLGDARRVLTDQDKMGFDVLVIDAYSSDAVPVHLTTVEAMELYMSHLSPDGVLVFHISNRYFDIDLPLVESAARLGLTAAIMDHRSSGAPGDTATEAVFIARKAEDFGALTASEIWEPLEAGKGPFWTDDYANPLSILRWGH
ncbi:hypothetical protein FIU97_13010 [Roseivivax sp. THAF40]|uniref:fused MFS/spermidine synthase n=1 Tax=unclassified Roseivivax TaxID=2639302 RepID=UPI0012694915|nr:MULTISPECIES: fused MFS/spermidine synthase [unclassified Roseivivax]QFS83692.1 hypothetical protein FIV09_12720 [Roseivivax sp. THAF197b]QFT47494.1 hypothetical protein FIU97_13010 [Roseivivax sp. THAF40]